MRVRDYIGKQQLGGPCRQQHIWRHTRTYSPRRASENSELSSCLLCPLKRSASSLTAHRPIKLFVPAQIPISTITLTVSSTADGVTGPCHLRCDAPLTCYERHTAFHLHAPRAYSTTFLLRFFIEYSTYSTIKCRTATSCLFHIVTLSPMHVNSMSFLSSSDLPL